MRYRFDPTVEIEDDEQLIRLIENSLSRASTLKSLWYGFMLRKYLPFLYGSFQVATNWSCIAVSHAESCVSK